MTIGASLLVHSTVLFTFAFANCFDEKCEPAEIGKNHSISCSCSGNYNLAKWFRITPTFPNPSLMIQCYTSSNSCDNPTPSFHANIYSYNNNTNTNFTIVNANSSNHFGIYQCAFDDKPYNVCNPLEFFSKPEDVNCSDLQIVDGKIGDGKNEMYIKCWLSRVIPAAKMTLRFLENERSIQCEKTKNNDFEECQGYLPMTLFKAGTNFIHISIYPNVSNGIKYGVNKSLSINLTHPQPALDEDCALISIVNKGYIKQGTLNNCTCKVQTQGVPKGTVQWYLHNGTAVGSAGNNQATILQLVFLGKEANLSYMCMGVSEIGNNEHRINFTVKNAYGPENVSLTTSGENTKYDICSPNKTIKIICSVPRQNVAPEPSVIISDSAGASLVLNTNHNSNEYIYIALYRPTTAGSFPFKCEAVNAIFSDLRSVADIKVLISGPPTQPPIITFGLKTFRDVYKKSLEPQKEGSDVDITCEVSGGFPNTYNMSVSCGENYNNSATNSDVVKLSLENVGRQLNGKQCVCKAQHVKSCYVNNTSNVTLNITYPATIHNFTANSNISSLTVSEHSNVTLFCDVDSNPPAKIEISKREQTAANNGKTEYFKQVICKDSGEYICKTYNSEVVKPVESSIVLYVLCSLQLQDSSVNKEIFSAKLGKPAVIIFDVLGFPAPISYSLYKTEQEYEHTNSSVENPVESRYAFEYTPSSLPFGRISVTIFNLTAEDFTNYIFYINNSIGTGMKLRFALIEDIKETNNEITAAAIAGGIAGFACIAVILIIITTIYKGIFQHHQLQKKSKYLTNLQYQEREFQNNDLYTFQSTDYSIKMNYKTYSDVQTTITTATALPKNLKSTQHVYFNSVDDDSQLKKKE